MGIDRTQQQVPRKTSPGENKSMMNDGNQKAQVPESEDSENLSGIAKAFLVNVAWSYAEALDRMKQPKEQEATAESPAASPAESPPE